MSFSSTDPRQPYGSTGNAMSAQMQMEDSSNFIKTFKHFVKCLKKNYLCHAGIGKRFIKGA